MSWQAVNDLSAHPATTGAPYHGNSVILNTLGDLTNRENRSLYQRFSSDFQNLAGTRSARGDDGLSDDVNGDNVPDYYPTLYPSVLPPLTAVRGLRERSSSNCSSTNRSRPIARRWGRWRFPSSSRVRIPSPRP